MLPSGCAGHGTGSIASRLCSSCHIFAFDHHESELSHLVGVDYKDRYIIDPYAKSAARVVYDYYGSAEKLPRISEELMEAVEEEGAKSVGILPTVIGIPKRGHPTTWMAPSRMSLLARFPSLVAREPLARRRYQQARWVLLYH